MICYTKVVNFVIEINSNKYSEEKSELRRRTDKYPDRQCDLKRSLHALKCTNHSKSILMGHPVHVHCTEQYSTSCTYIQYSTEHPVHLYSIRHHVLIYSSVHTVHPLHLYSKSRTSCTYIIYKRIKKGQETVGAYYLVAGGIPPAAGCGSTTAGCESILAGCGLISDGCRSIPAGCEYNPAGWGSTPGRPSL